MCYKISLIEAPKLVSIKQKRKKEKNCRRWTDNFLTHCILFFLLIQNPHECQHLSELRENLLKKISNLLNEYKSCGYLEGYSGDLIRPSLCTFIENISQSIDYFRQNKNDICLPNETIDCWQTIIDECISNLDDDIRQASLNALKAFSNAFYSNSRYA